MLIYVVSAVFWFIAGAITVVVMAFRHEFKKEDVTFKEWLRNDQKKWSEEEIRKNFK